MSSRCDATCRLRRSDDDGRTRDQRSAVDAGKGPGPRRKDRPARSLPGSSRPKVVDRSRSQDLLGMARRGKDGRAEEQEVDLRGVPDEIRVKDLLLAEVVDLPPVRAVNLQVVDRAGQVASGEMNHRRKKVRIRQKERRAGQGFPHSRSCRGCSVSGRSRGPGWSSSKSMVRGRGLLHQGGSRRG